MADLMQLLVWISRAHAATNGACRWRRLRPVLLPAYERSPRKKTQRGRRS
jgi:hypothetical protein